MLLYVRTCVSGPFSVYVNNLTTCHDFDEKVCVDRGINRKHVEDIKLSARHNPGIGQVSGNLLGFFKGSVKEFTRKDLLVQNKLKRKVSAPKASDAQSAGIGILAPSSLE